MFYILVQSCSLIAREKIAHSKKNWDFYHLYHLLQEKWALEERLNMVEQSGAAMAEEIFRLD